MNLDNVMSVPGGRLGRLITSLPSHELAEFREALLFALGFDWPACCRRAQSARSR